MPVRTVAILSPGDMGHAVGRGLVAGGLEVVTCLAGRSARTRGLAERGGIRDVPDLGAMLGAADLVLSILPPAEALALARRVAEAMSASGRRPPYADCNAVSPGTVREIAAVIEGAGAPFIDGGIIGPPPGAGQPTRFYVSGPRAALVAELDGMGIRVRPMGPEIGRASGIKMCYAGLTKGTRALGAAVLTAAEALGLTEPLREEFLYSQPAAWESIRASAPRLPVVAGRWAGEMREIAATFGAVGVTPRFHEGAAEILGLLAETPFAAETPETMDTSRTPEAAAKVYAARLKKK